MTKTARPQKNLTVRGRASPDEPMTGGNFSVRSSGPLRRSGGGAHSSVPSNLFTRMRAERASVVSSAISFPSGP